MTVPYLLDTNICIYIAKKRPLEVYQKLAQLSIGDVGMSLITFGELRFGAQKSQHQAIAAPLKIICLAVRCLPSNSITGSKARRCSSAWLWASNGCCQRVSALSWQLAAKAAPIFSNEILSSFLAFPAQTIRQK